MDATQKPHICGLRLADLEEEFSSIGVPQKKARYHARQVFQWLYQRKVESFEAMTDLSKAARAHLAEKFSFEKSAISAEQKSSDGTRKFLFKLFDENTIESVLIPAEDRLTICISSQVGCAMGCKFCLTGTMGLIRNLEVYEIVGQVLELSRQAAISNIVFMGMGEPLHNFENVCLAIEILVAQEGLNFSKRKVTVSTSGLVPQIRKFSERMTGANRVNLAISLNGTTDEGRLSVMPINKAYPINDLMRACREFELEPRRNITFEYVMMGGLNDSLEDAARLVGLTRGMAAKINLIPFNPHPASPYKRPAEETVDAFHKYLMDRNVNALIRHSRGRDISAACGQLKSEADQGSR